MTRAEKRIYELILALETVDGYPPIITELMKASGYKRKSSLERILEQLRNKGWIKSTPQNNHWSIARWE
jgi:SOS-response transcriptional repressor LexA